MTRRAGDITSLDMLTVKLEALHEDVREVKELAKITNGRVRTIELWRARMEGARIAVAWIPPLLTAIGGSAIGALIVLLIHP